MNCFDADDANATKLAQAIAQRVGPTRFNVWFGRSTKLQLKADLFEIAVPDEFVKDWIGRHFMQHVQDALCDTLGCSLPVKIHVAPVMFEEVGPGSGGKAQESVPAEKPARPPITSSKRNTGKASKEDVLVTAEHDANALPNVHGRVPFGVLPVARSAESRNGLDDRSPTRLRHELETFVVGASNKLAFDAIEDVAQFPGSHYNPLFLHGACGLGKTHLLQGLARRFATVHRTRRWIYCTGEEFTNEFVKAIRDGRTDNFRHRMRALDLLIIDDVHFLAGKRATQEEFLHTFNSIEAAGKQVVMASDAHPKMIESFGESLINRFVSGMVVRIDPPNFATRKLILQRLAERQKLQLTEPVMDWIAKRVTQSVRELEGALTRVGAHVRLMQRDADIDLVTEALGDLDRQLVAPISPDSVVASVCDYFGLTERELMSGRRQRTVSLARSVAMYLVRKTSKMSFPEIAHRMGKRNHSTVISACRRIERALAENEMLEWSSALGDRKDEAIELVQRLEESSRTP